MASFAYRGQVMSFLGSVLRLGAIATGAWVAGSVVARVGSRIRANRMLGSDALVATMLQALGYPLYADVGPWREPTDVDIKRFQQEYNLVTNFRTDGGLGNELRDEFYVHSLRRLEENGKIDTRTREAMLNALDMQKRVGRGFRQLAPSIVITEESTA